MEDAKFLNEQLVTSNEEYAIKRILASSPRNYSIILR